LVSELIDTQTQLEQMKKGGVNKPGQSSDVGEFTKPFPHLLPSFDLTTISIFFLSCHEEADGTTTSRVPETRRRASRRKGRST